MAPSYASLRVDQLRSAVTCATEIQSRLLLRALLSPAASAISHGSLKDKLSTTSYTVRLAAAA